MSHMEGYGITPEEHDALIDQQTGHTPADFVHEFPAYAERIDPMSRARLQELRARRDLYPRGDVRALPRTHKNGAQALERLGT